MKMIITGTSSGLGFFLAEYFLNQGCEVVGVARKVPIFNLAEATLARYFHYQVDLSIPEKVTELCLKIKNEHPRFSVLINNAGCALMNHTLLATDAKIIQTLQTNLVSAILISKNLAKNIHLAQNDYGRIINISTIAVPLNLEGEAVYAASKAGLETFTRVLSKEVYKLGITVNCVGPTVLATPMVSGLSEAQTQKFLNQTTTQKIGTFNEVLEIINFLLLPSSQMITGQTLYLGGVV